MEALCWTLVSCSCSETHCRKAHRGGPCCSRASRPSLPGGPPLPLHSGTADGGKDKGRVVWTAAPIGEQPSRQSILRFPLASWLPQSPAPGVVLISASAE